MNYKTKTNILKIYWRNSKHINLLTLTIIKNIIISTRVIYWAYIRQVWIKLK